MSICFIGLGSNLNAPVDQLNKARRAIEQLPQSRLLKCSSIYQSKALTLDNETQNDYMNAVIQLQTELTPGDLLEYLQTIENNQGRIREKRWGSRTLDLDILLFDDEMIQTPVLTVPHPEMGKRDFVLIPLKQITEDLEIPGLGKLDSLVSQLAKGSISMQGEFDG